MLQLCKTEVVVVAGLLQLDLDSGIATVGQLLLGGHANWLRDLWYRVGGMGRAADRGMTPAGLRGPRGTGQGARAGSLGGDQALRGSS